MDPQLPSHNGVFSLILQRMMLEAHAANGAILSNYGHVYPAGKDISMPLLPLSRNDSRAGNVSPSLQFWRKDSSSAHKRQNLEMKISLLKKRKELEVESQTKDSPLIKSNGNEAVVKGEAVADEGRDTEDGEASGESSDAKKECIIDLVDSADPELDVGTEQPPTDCEECGKRFASAFQLREHISIQHLKERNFVCEECGQKFGRRGGLRRHVQMVHQNHLHMCPYEGCDHPGYKCSK
ncbi:zinc finger, C2H2 type, partial [Ancylostoma ceylanicum]